MGRGGINFTNFARKWWIVQCHVVLGVKHLTRGLEPYVDSVGLDVVRGMGSIRLSGNFEGLLSSSIESVAERESNCFGPVFCSRRAAVPVAAPRGKAGRSTNPGARVDAAVLGLVRIQHATSRYKIHGNTPEIPRLRQVQPPVGSSASHASRPAVR